MTLDNGQYFDLIDNYDLVADYLLNNLWYSQETIDFAFDNNWLNEETFQDLLDWQGYILEDFEEYLKDNWEGYEEEQEEEEENEEESENMNSLDQNGDC